MLNGRMPHLKARATESPTGLQQIVFFELLNFAGGVDECHGESRRLCQLLWESEWTDCLETCRALRVSKLFSFSAIFKIVANFQSHRSRFQEECFP